MPMQQSHVLASIVSFIWEKDDSLLYKADYCFLGYSYLQEIEMHHDGRCIECKDCSSLLSTDNNSSPVGLLSPD